MRALLASCPVSSGHLYGVPLRLSDIGSSSSLSEKLFAHVELAPVPVFPVFPVHHAAKTIHSLSLDSRGFCRLPISIIQLDPWLFTCH